MAVTKEKNLEQQIAEVKTVSAELRKAYDLEKTGSAGLYRNAVEFYLETIIENPLMSRQISQEAGELGCAEEVLKLIQQTEDVHELKKKVKPRDYSDAGNAEVFAGVFGNDVRYCDAYGWLVWNGVRWCCDKSIALSNALQLSDAMLQDALAAMIADPEGSKAYLKHAQHTRSKRSIDKFLWRL